MILQSSIIPSAAPVLTGESARHIEQTSPLHQALVAPAVFPTLTSEIEQANALYRSRKPAFISNHLKRYQKMQAAQDTLFENLEKIKTLINTQQARWAHHKQPDPALCALQFETRMKLFMLQLGIDPDKADIGKMTELVLASEQRIVYTHRPSIKHLAKVVGGKVLPSPFNLLMADNDHFQMPTIRDGHYRIRADFGNQFARRQYPKAYEAAHHYFTHEVSQLTAQYPLDPSTAAEKNRTLTSLLPATISYGPRHDEASNPETTQERLDELSRDSIKAVRKAVASNPSTASATLDALSKDRSRSIQCNVARNVSTAARTLNRLIKQADAILVLKTIAQRDDDAISKGMLLRIAKRALTEYDDKLKRGKLGQEQIELLSIVAANSKATDFLPSLSIDPHAPIRIAAVESPHTDATLLTSMAAKESDPKVASSIMRNSNTGNEQIHQLLTRFPDNLDVWEAVTRHQNLDQSVINVLLTSQDAHVISSLIVCQSKRFPSIAEKFLNHANPRIAREADLYSRAIFENGVRLAVI